MSFDIHHFSNISLFPIGIIKSDFKSSSRFVGLIFTIHCSYGALFIDLGSAWNDNYTIYNDETGQLQDLKADMGFGLRMSLYPLIILKLDFAWAYDLESFHNREILFSLGFEF